MKNKIIGIITVLMLTLSFFACGDKEVSNENLFTPGTYEGVSKGYHGDIKVKVTVDKDKINKIETEHTETEGLGDKAIETLVSNLVEENSLAVDSVSGATFSSEGFLNAVEDALTKSGVDIEKLKSETEKENIEKTNKDIETDVLIIGGGGAGLSAAVSAHQNGAKVVVVEKMPSLGGNTIISGSAYNAVDDKRQKALGIEDSIDKHFEQTFEGGDKKGDKELIRTLVENAYPTIEWLESLGMEFKDDIFTVLGGMWPRAHKPVKPLGTGYIETYKEYIEKNSDDIQVLLETEVTDLLVNDDKSVTGAKASSKSENISITAKNGVIVATGGFGANAEMREEYNTMWPSLKELKTTNHTGATGDGLIMAEKVGAELTQMENIQLLPMGDPKTGSLSGNIEQGVENRIFINKEGNRFVDEGSRRDTMTKALMEQEDSEMWVIVDSHSYPDGSTVNNFNESIDSLVEEGRAFKADTLEELADLIGVDKDNLVKSVENFNLSVDGSNQDEFGRSLFMDKLDSKPYYAGKRVPTVHHTMGGIKINKDTQVININGDIIAGLYAAGEVTGGIHGSNRLGGNALADVNTFGRIAGEKAAKNIK